MKYLAKFKVEAYEYSFGGSRPYEENKEWGFEANNDEEAQKMAMKHRFEIGKGLIGPTVTLESLIQVGKVILKKEEKETVNES